LDKSSAGCTETNEPSMNLGEKGKKIGITEEESAFWLMVARHSL
jgi:hypothetical protein